MTEFRLSKNDRLVGIIDVTNKGFSITSREDLFHLISENGMEFICTESEMENNETTYFFRATMPTETMVQVLTRLKPILVEIGYEILA